MTSLTSSNPLLDFSNLLSLQIGLLSPPFGMLTFTMKSVVPAEITLNQVFITVMPYVAIGLLMMVAILAYPPIATWLPALFE